MQLNERDIEYSIDNQLVNLGWILDHKKSDRSVYRQYPRSKEEKEKLGLLRPDYVLYDILQSNRAIAIIEAKRPNEKLSKALEQAITYAKKISAPIAIATDGYRMKTWHLKHKAPLFVNDVEVDELFSVELSSHYKSDNTYSSFIKVSRVERGQLIKKFAKANSILKDEGLSAGIERFSVFANLMFLKMQLEVTNSIAGHSWSDLDDKQGKVLVDSIKNIFRELKSTHSNIFDEATIRDPKRLERIIEILSSFHLSSINDDVKGVAFEHFIHSYTGGLKNDLGQYFTPRHIVKMIVSLINPVLGEKIYDPFCGTGGMLIECFRRLKQNVSTEEELLELKHNSVFGCDNSGVAKIAMMNMIMFGDGHSNILKQDSYSRHAQTKGKYDIVITNIPFSQSTDCFSSYPVIPASDKNGDSIGVQHCLEALKPSSNSRAAIIVPISFLYKSDLSKEREYIVNNFTIERIVELSPKCFNPYTETQTAVMIIKYGKNKEANKKCIYHTITNDGYSQNAYRIPVLGENDIDRMIDNNEGKFINLVDDFDFKQIPLVCTKNEYPLDTFAKVKKGDSVAPNTSPRYVTGGTESIAMVSDLAKGHIDYYLNDSSFLLNEKAISEKKLFLFPKNTVVIPTTGKASLLNHRALTSKKFYLIQHLTGIYSKGEMHPFCLFYFFLNYKIDNIVYDLGYPAIKKTIVEKIPFPNYSDKRQNEIIDEISDLIALQKEMKEKHINIIK